MNQGEESLVLKTAKNLEGVADIFRTKIYGGGTTVDKWFPGIGSKGIETLKEINMPVSSEAQLPCHIELFKEIDGLWIGARNSSNYGLLQSLKGYNKLVMLKRGDNMSIKQVVHLYHIMQEKIGITPFIIERGISTVDKDTPGRWSPDLKIAYVLKKYRPDIFARLIIDCAHSAGDKDYIPDIYKAFKAIGIKHFMFEVCDYESKTDKDQILTSNELKKILEA
jgi:3-deoxy-D-arabino-heptulosonate 7-phosphate (DAHP) synthase